MKNIFKLTNDKFIKKIRKYGAVVGNNVIFFSPEKTNFDFGKAFFIKIGDYSKISGGVTILAHDYSRSVARMVYKKNIGGSAPVVIGKNCFVGMNATIMMGTTIGDNCIIGAGSVVKGTFESNSVIAGNPAKKICTLEEYIVKREQRCVEEALMCVKHMYEYSHRYPTIEEMGDGFAWMYLPRTEQSIERYPRFFELKGDNMTQLVQDFMSTEPKFESYDAFIDYAKKELNI